jgi:hypothetical protein
VAPRHGFDRVTLAILREEGIDLVSDGFAASPFRKYRMTWIPQQLWGPASKTHGLWTICVHTNTATEDDFKRLERFLEESADQFTSVDRVLAEWTIRRESVADRVFHSRMAMRIRLKMFRRGLVNGSYPRRLMRG